MGGMRFHITGGARFALIAAVVAGCSAVTQGGDLPVGTADDVRAAEIDTIFAANGCSMTSAQVDAALSGRPDLEHALQQMLLRADMTLRAARPQPIITSTRGECA